MSTLSLWDRIARHFGRGAFDNQRGLRLTKKALKVAKQVAGIVKKSKTGNPHKKMSHRDKIRKLPGGSQVSSSASSSSRENSVMQNDDLEYAYTKIGRTAPLKGSKLFPLAISKVFKTHGVVGQGGVYGQHIDSVMTDVTIRKLIFEKMAYRQQLGSYSFANVSGYNTSKWQYGIDGTLGTAGIPANLENIFGRKNYVNISSKFEILSGSESLQECDVFWIRARNAADKYTEAQVLTKINQILDDYPAETSAAPFEAQRFAKNAPGDLVGNATGAKSLLVDFRSGIGFKQEFSCKFLRRFKIKPGALVKWKVIYPAACFDTQNNTVDADTVSGATHGFLFFRVKGQPVMIVTKNDEAPIISTFSSITTTPTCLGITSYTTITMATKPKGMTTAKKIYNWLADTDYKLSVPSAMSIERVNIENDEIDDMGVTTAATLTANGGVIFSALP